MIELVYLGLGLIAIAWIIQLGASLKGRKEIRKPFLWTYALGALVLAYDGYIGGGLSIPVMLNALTAILAALIGAKGK